MTTWAVPWESRRSVSVETHIRFSHSLGCFTTITTVTFAPSILVGHLQGRLILRCSDNLVILTTLAILWGNRGVVSVDTPINDTPTALAVSPSSSPPPLHPPSLVVFFRDLWFSWGSLPYVRKLFGRRLSDSLTNLIGRGTAMVFRLMAIVSLDNYIMMKDRWTMAEVRWSDRWTMARRYNAGTMIQAGEPWQRYNDCIQWTNLVWWLAYVAR